MTAQPPEPLVVVVDGSAELAGVIVAILREEGLRAVSLVASLADDLPAITDFLVEQAPTVCLVAVSFPYERDWVAFRMLRRLFECGFVVTTTDVRALEKLPPDEEPPPVIVEPFALDELVDTVRRALPAVLQPREAPRG